MNDQTPRPIHRTLTVGTPVRDRVHPAAIVLALGFALYMFVQVGLVLGPITARAVPPGTTDAFVYIAKAEQLRTCPRQRCPALVDLHRQVKRETGLPAQISRQRALTHQRALLQYHLVHSVILMGLRALGLDYPLALNIISVAGAILIAAGITWLLIAALGPGPAGIGLALLAFAVYPGYHGLHWIVPSTLALGLGMLAWAAVLARPRGLGLFLTLLILAMVWMHPIGRVYAGVALALYGVQIAWGNPRRWIVVLIGLVALVTPMIAAQFIERPALAYLGLHAEDGAAFWPGVERNARAAWWAMRPWLIERGGAALICLALLGLVIAERERRRTLVILACLFGGLAATSVLYILPRYPAELFHRLFVPFAMLVTGIAAFAIWRSVVLFVAPRGRAGRGGFAGWLRSAAGLSVRILGLAVVAVAAVLATIGATVNGSRAVLGKARYMTVWGVMPLDAGQPARVLAKLPSGARIVYFDDLSWFFYASNGALANGAVFNPAVTGTDLAKTYYKAAGRVALSVRARDGFYGYVALRQGRHVVIRTKTAVDWSQVRIKLKNGGNAMELSVRVLGGGGAAPVRMPVDSASSGWRTLGVPAGATGRTLVISRRDAGPLAWIEGVRLSPEVRTAWPWDRGVTIVKWKKPAPMARVEALIRTGGAWPSQGKSVAVHSFETWTLAPAGCRHLAVVEDFGATVASRIACGEPGADKPRGSGQPRRAR